MNKNVRIAAAAVLALSLTAFGFTGCGQSNSTAGSADNGSSVSASADSESGNAIKPNPLGYTVSENMPDGTYSVDLDVSTLEEQADGTYKIHATIEAYDTYDIVDMHNLKAGDTIQVAGQDMKVETVETDESNGMITVNGGIEEGGCYLTPMPDDSNGYRTMSMDDYPVYYVVGETDLTISDSVKLSDAFGGEPSDAPTTVDYSGFAKYMQENNSDYWNCNSTSVLIENGQVTQINRIWVP